MKVIKTYLRAALALVLGERCVVCGQFLPGAGVCPDCLLRLPYINIRGVAANPIERLLWATTPIERASAMLAYRPGFEIDSLLHAIKYRGRADLAVTMGRLMAQELLTTDFFDGIDTIVPVPLHPLRQRKRGYNQSERLARGVSDVTGIPVADDIVRRTVDNISQTALKHHERIANVRNIFGADAARLAACDGRHILLIDDVITTGATIGSCASVFLGTDVRISILALAFASTLRSGRLEEAELSSPDQSVSNEEFLSRRRRSLS